MSEPKPTPHIARLSITCPDRPGIVAEMAIILYKLGCNIISSDQYSTDPNGGHFFMRMVFDLGQADAAHREVELAIAQAAEKFNMNWQITYTDQIKRMAMLVSKYDHGLLDLLWRWQSGELNVKIPFVISNRADRAGNDRT